MTINVPKIRFNEFKKLYEENGGEENPENAYAWKKRALGNLGNTFTGLSGKTKEHFGHGDGRFVTYMNIFSNPIAKIDGIDAIEIDNKQHQVKRGDVFFTTSSETPEEVGMSSVWIFDIPNIYLNSFSFGYRPTVEFDLNYLAFMLRSPSVRKDIMLLAQGISRFNISKAKAMDIEVPVPEIEEQKKIGEMFANINQLITVNQRKLDLLKLKKKAYLQKMFPKEGAGVPELRFEGFADAWEKRQLKDVLSFLKDGTHGTHTDGGYAYLLSAKNISNGNITIDDSDRKIGEGEYNSIFKNYSLEINDVLMTIVGTIGRTARYISPDPMVAFQRSVAILRSDDDTDSVFLEQSLSTKMVQQELDKMTSTSAQGGVYLRDVAKLTFYRPVLEEQIRIGKLLSKIDSLITVNQRELDNLKVLKKSLLQKMFI